MPSLGRSFAIGTAVGVLAGLTLTPASAPQAQEAAGETARETADPQQAWPQWRGPLATGTAPGADPPVRWSESQNVRWKVAIPGDGQATPLVWGDRVFVTTAVAAGGAGASEGIFRRLTRRIFSTEAIPGTLQYAVLAFDRRTGELAWERAVQEEAPHEGKHKSGSWASSSAVTDGDVLCAFFGSRGLHCLDMDGNLLWDRDFGDMEIRFGFGEGASPALHAGVVVVNWDHQGESFITALDARTGRELWRTERDEMTSWATPLVVEHGGRTQVVTNATNRVRSYDFETGDLIWDGEGGTVNAIPTPVAADGLVYLLSGYRGNRLYAVKLDAASGDIDGADALAWTLDQDTPYVPSPLLHDGILYFTKGNGGVLSAYDARTGQPHYGPRRLPGVRNVYASPVAAGGRIYVPSRDGTTAVIAAGPTFEVISANMLDDGFDASPAVVGGELYLRGRRNLYCIAAD